MTVNADQKELENFNNLSSTWWDENGSFKALHKINPIRIEFIKKFQVIEKQKILDIGCGGGILSEALATLGADITGIDLADEVLNIAKLHSLESGTPVNYQLISAEEFAKQNPEKFDIVTCMEMLEHVPDPASIIQAAADAVKPNGWVFFSTLNRNYKAYLLAIFTAENVLNIVPKGTHTLEKFIKPSELDAMARQARLTLTEGAGIDFNPLLKRYGLSKKLDVNYLLAYQKVSYLNPASDRAYRVQDVDL